ncbi:G-protein coupled receptor 87 [Oryzias melastigma]|uniref:G-protein coupled receptor 87 n=1 Tax=Oryzias melastigma TaxID=30732 RepID=A0A834CBU0_ORYME|nr:P2Y purinoceptor 14 [Oryzias melastigma]KAF6726244.1 G-protein coupled receptor 87 [Oryzias melastigma]
MNNSMENQTNISDLDSIFILRVLPSLYCLIFVVGLPLNCMAAWTFFRVGAESGLVVYLQNMMLADLLMLITIPLRVADTLGLKNKDLFVITCRYTDVLFYNCLYMGIILIGFISLERYVKIVHPSSSASCTSRFSVLSLLRYLEKTRPAWVVVAISWVLIFSIVLPNVVMTSLEPTGQTFEDCMKLKTPMGVKWHKGISVFDTSLFWVTLVIVTFCYGSIGVKVYRSRRSMGQDSTGAFNRSNRSIFSILVVFSICFVPYHACRIQYTLCQVQDSNDGCKGGLVLRYLKEVTLLLSALNICLNPIVYFLMCPKFKETLKKKLSEKRRKRSHTVLSTLSST